MFVSECQNCSCNKTTTSKCRGVSQFHIHNECNLAYLDLPSHARTNMPCSPLLSPVSPCKSCATAAFPCLGPPHWHITADPLVLTTRNLKLIRPHSREQRPLPSLIMRVSGLGKLLPTRARLPSRRICRAQGVDVIAEIKLRVHSGTCYVQVISGPKDDSISGKAWYRLFPQPHSSSRRIPNVSSSQANILWCMSAKAPILACRPPPSTPLPIHRCFSAGPRAERLSKMGWAFCCGVK